MKWNNSPEDGDVNLFRKLLSENPIAQAADEYWLLCGRRGKNLALVFQLFDLVNGGEIEVFEVLVPAVYVSFDVCVGMVLVDDGSKPVVRNDD
jgi:hypothetical protein